MPKGYTPTEYINDINRENTEVLAEYGADEKVRQAYTYGESGIGERVSVDKSEESSYYLYDGRNSVTGILTETANLTNSYQYDSYGNPYIRNSRRCQLLRLQWGVHKCKNRTSVSAGQDTITQRTEPLQLKIVTLERQKIH